MMKSTEEDYCHEHEGLACPPMDDYALSDAFFYGDHQGSGINLDPSVFFSDLSKQEDGEEVLYPPKKKQPLLTRYNGKGKEWNRVLQVLQPDMEMLAKVNTRLELIRCRPAVKGVIVHKSASVTKPRKTVKIIVKKQVNVVMHSSSSSMQKKNNSAETKRPDTMMPMNENDFELKLEATKRKLRDLYEQSNNLKKQRTTQLIDLPNLPPMPATNKKSLKAKPKPKVGRTKTVTWNKFR